MRIIRETATLGYGTRFPDYGGDYDNSRKIFDDGRDSIAVPVFVEAELIAILNLTWIKKVSSVERIVPQHLERLRQAAAEIANRLMA